MDKAYQKPADGMVNMNYAVEGPDEDGRYTALIFCEGFTESESAETFAELMAEAVSATLRTSGVSHKTN